VCCRDVVDKWVFKENGEEEMGDQGVNDYFAERLSEVKSNPRPKKKLRRKNRSSVSGSDSNPRVQRSRVRFSSDNNSGND